MYTAGRQAHTHTHSHNTHTHSHSLQEGCCEELYPVYGTKVYTSVFAHCVNMLPPLQILTFSCCFSLPVSVVDLLLVQLWGIIKQGYKCKGNLGLGPHIIYLFVFHLSF